MARDKLSTRDTLRLIDRSLSGRLRRVRQRLMYIIQATIGAGLAYWFAHTVVGHPQPFFAPMAVVIILGLSGGDRMKRAVELSAGGVLGVLFGTLLVQNIGTGPLHMTIIIGLVLLAASFLSSSQLVSNQAAIGSILIGTILPPTGMGGIDRAVDALIGSAVGIATIALIPSSPLREGRREVAKVLRMTGSILADVAKGLRAGDAAIIEAARDAVRGSQGAINTMLNAAKGGKETATVSPFMWGAKRRIRSLERILTPVDNCVRGVRVLARRALVLAEDGDHVSGQQLELLEELSDVADELGLLYGQSTRDRRRNEATLIPELTRRLRLLAARAGVDAVDEKATLSAYAVLAQTRSIIVDLLMVCGLSRESAVAALVPTSETPAYPPEVLKGE